MGWLITALMLLSPAAPSSADALVPSRDLIPATGALVQEIEPVSFDLLDYRQSLLDEKKNIQNEDPHTIFVVKRHVGVSVGYDNTVVHGSVGLYLTVAELGRWNFGVPSIGVGWGRYPIYDRAEHQAIMKSEPTVFVSVASVHYRLGYLRQFGVNWYLNLEQVYDLRYNMSGSQFGVSFSSK
jgi:hypothetical protein